MQHTLLGSMAEGSTDTLDILIPMPKLGKEPFIYICLSPVETADFMYPK